MGAYLLQRSLQAAATLLVFLTAVFFLVQAQPGDFSQFYIRPDVPRESRDAIAEAFGLHRPAWQQFLIYLRNALTGDFGVSFVYYPRTVASLIAERLPRTLLLFLSATVISYYLGFLIGKHAAWRRGSLFEQTATIGSVYLSTVFIPWFALLAIWFFSLRLGWFPLGQFITPERWQGAAVTSNQVFLGLLGTAFLGSLVVAAAWLLARRGGAGRRLPLMSLALFSVLALSAWWASGAGGLAADILWHALLPIAVLSVVSTAGVVLLTRSSMLGVLKEDYVNAARARGLPDNVVRDRYAARNAVLPVVTSFVFSLALAIDGSVIVEAVFSWPGMGMTLIDAALNEDLPLAVGAFVFTGGFALAAHLAVDLLAMRLDPRVRP